MFSPKLRLWPPSENNGSYANETERRSILEAYPDTILDIGDSPKLAIDLRQAISVETRRAVKEMGIGPAFAVITAYNPLGRDTDQEENLRRTDDLKRELEPLGATVIPADGVSPDGMHREKGWVATIPLTQATTLAKNYGQAAFFWFDGDQFWIMPALVQAEPIALPVCS